MAVHGRAWIRDYDEGVVLTLQAVLSSRTVDGDPTPFYGLDLSGVGLDGPPGYNGLVPVFFTEPGAPFQVHIFPSITIRRNEIEPDMTAKSWWGQSVLPAATANTVDLGDGRTGPDLVEVLPRPEFFKIPYDVILAAQLEGEAQVLLKHVLAICRFPGFVVAITDDLDEERTYDANDVTVSKLSELADINERMASYSVSFRLDAELDLLPPEEHETLTAPVTFTYNGVT